MKTPVFIHLPRTGGTFLTEYFRSYVPEVEILPAHGVASDFEGDRDECFLFGFVRSPWDWYVSRYFYFGRKHIEEQGVSKATDAGLFGDEFTKKFPSFASHMKFGQLLDNFSFTKRYRQMFCYLGGGLAVDFVGKFEDVADDLAHIFDMCGISPQISYAKFCERHGNNTQWVNGSNHAHYTQYFTKESAGDIDIENVDRDVIKTYRYKYYPTAKRQLCTLSDVGYVGQGTALIKSLQEHGSNFDLHYLCLDAEIYNILSGLRIDNIHLYTLDDCGFDKDSRGYKFFCWSLASRFLKYLMDTNKEVDSILYIDSDIAFYSNIENLYTEIGNKDVGILPHLHVTVGCPVGGYNVGVIYFKNSSCGRECLDFWVKCVVDPKNPYSISHGMCGDQKYLELFPEIFGEDNVHVIESTGHCAPWNLHIQDVKLDDGIWYINFKGGDFKPLMFCHFSGYEARSDGTFNATRERFNEKFLEKDGCQKLYSQYCNQVITAMDNRV